MQDKIKMHKRVLQYLDEVYGNEPIKHKDIMSDLYILSINGSIYIAAKEYKGRMNIKTFDKGVYEYKNGKHRLYFVLDHGTVHFVFGYYKQDETVKDRERKQILKFANEAL